MATCVICGKDSCDSPKCLSEVIRRLDQDWPENHSQSLAKPSDREELMPSPSRVPSVPRQQQDSRGANSVEFTMIPPRKPTCSPTHSPLLKWMAGGSVAIVLLLALTVPAPYPIYFSGYLLGHLFGGFIGALILMASARLVIKTIPSFWTAYWICVFGGLLILALDHFMGFYGAYMLAVRPRSIAHFLTTNFLIYASVTGVALRLPDGRMAGFWRAALVAVVHILIAAVCALMVFGTVSTLALLNHSESHSSEMASQTTPSSPPELSSELKSSTVANDTTTPSAPSSADVLAPATSEGSWTEADDIEYVSKQWPDTLKDGSPLYIAIGKEVTRLEAEEPAFFEASDWRSRLVRQVSRDLKAPTLSMEEQVERAKHEAARRYPAIGRLKSPENQLYVETYQELKKSGHDEFFDDPDWPITLVELVARREGWKR